MSNRKYDMNTERIIIDFLDSNLYPGICAKPPIWYDDKVNQLKGKDCDIFFEDLTAISVDVKCAHDYVKTDISEGSLPTFAFELSFCKNGEEIQGWLYDTSKVTKYYLLSWLWAKKETEFEHDDILKLECCLVERQNIIAFLAENGLYPANALEINKKIRESGRNGQYKLEEFSDFGLKEGFHFYYSKNAKEEGPINIVVYKKHLLSLATKRFTLPIND